VIRKSKSLYSITHVDQKGQVQSRRVIKQEKKYWLETIINGHDPAVQELASDSLVSALQSEPLLTTIGKHVTRIVHSKTIDTQELLSVLVVGDLDADSFSSNHCLDCEQGEFLTVEEIEDFEMGDEVIGQVHLEEGLSCDPRWITINGDRAFVVSGQDFFAVVPVDVESNELTFTKTLLEWEFHNDSMGPMAWGGSAELGECGSRLWVLNRQGDIEPGCWITAAPIPDAFVDQFILLLDREQWVLPYLVQAFAKQFLSESEVRLLGENEVQGQWVRIHLGEQLAEQVNEGLLDPRWGLKELTDALLDPQSLRGLCVYGWLRQVAYGPYWSASWFDVFTAMLGEKGPPPVENAPEGMLDQWKTTAETFKALDYRLRGYAPDIEIPGEIREKVKSVKHVEVDLRAIETEIDELTEQTSQGLQDKARAVLRVPPDSNSSQAWKSFQRLTDEHPARMFEFHEAYWSIQHYQSRLDRLKELSPIQVELRDATDVAQTINWPLRWPVVFAPLWVELGGTTASARSWVTQGWRVQEVLSEAQLKSAWNGSIEERVQQEKAPKKQTN
jgi:hypothetical protein